CEACHGPGETHVRLNQDPARRYALQLSGKGDPSIVHPERLTVGRRDEICARCHGALVPKKDMWDPVTHRDPFIPGMELTRFNFHFWSEAQQAKLAADQRESALPLKPAPTDGRFWGDGTPLTTALEYNGMALSKCYLNGQGDMSCLSCHTMHPDNPNLMLKPGMDGNEACLQCHSQFRNQLEEHTRHAPGSPGSLCFNCHMPHQVFSLMTTHRSHRIQVPTIQDSLGTGKPHACNLCHLDKSLGWTRDQLRKWSPGLGESRPSLSPEEETLPAALLLLTQGDARTRAVVAGAFMKGAFRQTGQHEWAGPLLTAVLEKETYPMVRDVLARALRSLYGDEIARGYQPQDLPNRRDQQLRWLRDRMGSPRLNPGRSGFPLRPDGSLDVSAILKRIESRPDPHVTINE
ncbi:MAG: cytochrome c3 family protein, partial [Gemmataceae bacterium]